MIPFAANALQALSSIGEENPMQNCSSPWDFVTLPEEDPATAICNMRKKLVKIACVAPEICSRTARDTDTHTHRHAHRNTSPPRSRGRSKKRFVTVFAYLLYSIATHTTQAQQLSFSIHVAELTSSSAAAQRPREPLSQLKYCQLLHNCTKNHFD